MMRGLLIFVKRFSRRLDSLQKVRVELTVFFILFFTYGYFHQGGGWNQNSRFDQIRSIAERGEFEINDYMVYQASPDPHGQPRLTRFVLPPGVRLEQITSISNTGDVALFQGRVYPNKPPGTVLTGIPAYLVIYQLERMLGLDPDDWWTLTINAYLTTVFSVGLLTALGGVAFYRISLRLFPWAPVWTHAVSTMTFGTGTMILPFATMLFDHNIVAVLSLLSFWLLLVLKDSGLALARAAVILLAAGVLSGLTVVMNYSSVVSLVLFTPYAGWAAGGWRKVVFFLVGVMFPLIFLAWYHLVGFGSMLADANTYQYGMFGEKEMILSGMFAMPRLDVMIEILVSGHRGLFFTSPVLLLSSIGFCLMWIRRQRRMEMALFAALFIGFLLMNSSFNGWDSGWSIGPRYLIPALPFLSLPLTLVLEKLPRATLLAAFLSAGMMLVATAVDPQPPPDIQNPFIHYIVPLVEGATFVSQAFGNAVIRGPVSANPIGVYESWFRPVFHARTVQRQWNSFNLGEFVWPASLSSLAPLACLLGLGFALLWYWCRRSTLETRQPVIIVR